MTIDSKPRVLIEDWLPVEELGIESRRERAVSTTLPPISRLHVWWARRPLAASAAVVLAGVLPAWSAEVEAWMGDYLSTLDAPERRELLSPRPKLLPRRDYRAPSEAWYHDWLLHLAGVWGDPVTARRAYDAAVQSGVRIPNPYNYLMAYKNGPSRTHIQGLHALLSHTWGGSLPLILDSTAGGGSIPFVSVRCGLPTRANDLNGVAAAVLEAGVRAPAELGLDLMPVLEEWGGLLVGRVRDRLTPYFPAQEREEVLTYIWAHAVTDPRVGRLVPLMTDKWLRKDKGKEVAVRIVVERNGEMLPAPEFEIVTGRGVDAADAARGTIANGTAVSPYDSLVIDGDYIKQEAQAGRMSQVLYAVACRDSAGNRFFRAPLPDDMRGLALAEEELARLSGRWAAEDVLPTEEIPTGNYDRGHRMYGIYTWADMFTPRQRLVHGVFVEEYRRIIPEVRDSVPGTMADEVLLQLGLMVGKGINWNARATSWDVSRQKMRSFFDKHNFSFKWMFAEFEGSKALYPWTMHVIENYGQIAELLDNTAPDPSTGQRLFRQVIVTQGNAGDLPDVESASVAHVCIDPPYYDNVMYAELADFFYVWEKRTLGWVRPDFFRGDLTDKENEAIANPARFASMGRRKKELADADYESKMTAIFAEARRVLRDDGVLSVMFTHKRAEAWDTLGASLLTSGFTIETSWPVNTEAENSLHQANVNSAASTIMLVCRKREDHTGSRKVFLDDIESEVRAASREAAQRFQQAGIDGVDLLLSTYGPSLSVISQHWPVYSSTPDESGRERVLRPEEALSIARQEVVHLRRARLVGRAAHVDDVTDFVMLAWDVFGAREFSFDTARLLALAVGGLDLEELERAKVLAKKSGTVRLLEPRERVRRIGDDAPGVHPSASTFASMIDAVHTVLHVADVDGMHAAKALMDRAGLTEDEGFLATVQGLVNAIPRAKHKGQWINPEAGLLDTLVTAYLPSIEVPAEKEMQEVAQASLFDVE
ncbi:MAG: DUF1156 domain-containing protein [Coriobacteriia bacterium]|nr:DUF1156 domain-containing protein [Coriobacteriia bacterium]